MNGWAQLYWSFPNFNLNFGSGRHFAGLDDDEEVLLMKVLFIIEVVLEVERL